MEANNKDRPMTHDEMEAQLIAASRAPLRNLTQEQYDKLVKEGTDEPLSAEALRSRKFDSLPPLD